MLIFLRFRCSFFYTFKCSVTSPEDEKKLAALDRHAADTREAVYRGFETIDAQKRDLDFARANSESQRAESVKTFQSTERRSLYDTSYAAPADRVEPQVSTHAIASAGRQERHAEMNDLEREFRETKLSHGHIDSDREWHFDSLRDVLRPEHVDHSITSHDRDEKADHLVERGMR